METAVILQLTFKFSLAILLFIVVFGTFLLFAQTLPNDPMHQRPIFQSPEPNKKKPATINSNIIEFYLKMGKEK